MRTPLRIGHRGGASGHEPENTIRSLYRGLELGIGMSEIDVQLTRDGRMAVIHDETLDRTTSGTGRVMDKTWAELSILDAGHGEKIPSLTEFLAAVNRRVPVNIELKGPGTEGPVIDLLDALVRPGAWKTDDFLISSFDLDRLAAFHRARPVFRTGALLNEVPDDLYPLIMRLAPSTLNVNRVAVNPAMVDRAHALGLKVFAFTVNEPSDIALMLACGVDGLFTDYPERVPLSYPEP